MTDTDDSEDDGHGDMECKPASVLKEVDVSKSVLCTNHRMLKNSDHKPSNCLKEYEQVAGTFLITFKINCKSCKLPYLKI